MLQLYELFYSCNISSIYTKTQTDVHRILIYTKYKVNYIFLNAQNHNPLYQDAVVGISARDREIEMLFN